LRRAGLLLALIAVVLGAPLPAAAHLKLDSSKPARGDTVRTALTQLELHFSLRVELRYTTVTLVTAQGDTIRTTVQVTGANGRDVAATLPTPLSDGTYKVVWHTAGPDGHVVNGSYEFVVSGVSPPVTAAAAVDTTTARDSAQIAPDAPQRDENLRSIAVAVRWFNFIFLLLAIGGVIFHALLLGRAAARPADINHWAAIEQRATRLAMIAGIGSLVMAVPRLALQSSALNGAANTWNLGLIKTLLLDTNWGHGWVLQVLGSVGYLMAVFAAEPGKGGAWWLAAASTVVLAFAPAFSGHAAAMEQTRAITVTNDAAHVFAASTWLGTLTYILVVALPVCMARRAFEQLALLVRKFSPLALLAASAAALTGTVSALEHIGPLTDLWNTPYGRALSVKLGCVFLVALMGFYNWRWVRPGLGTKEATVHLRRSALGEVTFALMVLLVTSVLIALPTP
jgi:copper transport protein